MRHHISNTGAPTAPTQYVLCGHAPGRQRVDPHACLRKRLRRARGERGRGAATQDVSEPSAPPAVRRPQADWPHPRCVTLLPRPPHATTRARRRMHLCMHAAMPMAAAHEILSSGRLESRGLEHHFVGFWYQNHLSPPPTSMCAAAVPPAMAMCAAPAAMTSGRFLPRCVGSHCGDAT